MFNIFVYFTNMYYLCSENDKPTRIMRKGLIFSLIALLAWPFVVVSAQNQVNMKFGKPTKEELQMSAG